MERATKIKALNAFLKTNPSDRDFDDCLSLLGTPQRVIRQRVALDALIMELDNPTPRSTPRKHAKDAPKVSTVTPRGCGMRPKAKAVDESEEPIPIPLQVQRSAADSAPSVTRRDIRRNHPEEVADNFAAARVRLQHVAAKPVQVRTTDHATPKINPYTGLPLESVA